MLKRSILVCLLMAMSQLSLAGKIVVFDPDEALLRTNVAKQKIEALKAKPEYAQMLAQAESLKADLEALGKEANSKGMTWSAEERNEHRKKIEYVQADLKLAAQKLQTENNVVINAIVEEMRPKLEKALTQYVESNDIDMVLRKQVSVISKPAVDITAAIASELDKLK